MKRLATLLFAVLTVFALAATMATSAFAGLEALNAEGKPTAATISGSSEKTGTLSILGNSLEIKCSKGSTEATVEAGGKLGTGHVSIERCSTTLGGECTGLGDAAGTVLGSGTAHIAANTTLTVGYILFLVEHAHFSCTVLGITKLFLVLGEILCQVTPINTLSSKFTVTCQKGAERGDPAVTSYENDKGEAVTLANALKVSEGDTTETMAALEGSGEVTVTPQLKIDI